MKPGRLWWKTKQIFIKGLMSINFAEIKECMFLFCRVTEALFSLVQRGTNTAVVAMSTINNLALEKGYDVCIMWNMLWRAVHLSFLSFLSLNMRIFYHNCRNACLVTHWLIFIVSKWTDTWMSKYLFNASTSERENLRICYR